MSEVGWSWRFMVCVVGLAACSIRPLALNDDNDRPSASVDGGTDSPPLTWSSDGAPADGTPVDGAVDSAPVVEPRNDAALPAEVLSCLGLPTTCGANGNDSCCNSPEVTGGSYFRSYDLAGDLNLGKMIYPATVSSFRLDKYEVTVGRFRAFVNAGMGTQSNPPLANSGAHEKIVGSGWDASWNAKLLASTPSLSTALKCNSELQTWTDKPGDNENRPISCVTWYEAAAFCAWDGGYLPTESEWNYAATGGDQQRAYPWSSPAASLTIDGAHAVYYDSVTEGCVDRDEPDCTLSDLLVVGSKPEGDGRWGQSDLAASLYEWTLDLAAPYESPCADCAGLTRGWAREIRGGSYASSAWELRAGIRHSFVSTDRVSLVGFRCARRL
jgi:formylglycine-generating enzyme required for sulfatase activity